MFKIIFRLIPKEKYLSFYWLLILFIIVGFLETLGIGLFIPILNSFSGDSNLSIPIIENITDLIFNKINIINFEITIFLIFISVFILKNLILLHTLRFQNKFLQDIFRILSSNLLKKYFNQDYVFHIKNNSSKLIRNLSSDLLLYQSTLMHLLVFISKFIIVLGIFSLLLMVNFVETIYGILIFCITYLIFNYFTKSNVVEWGKKRHFFSGEWIKDLQQSLSSINILKIFNAEKYFISKYNVSISNLTQSARKHDNLQGYPRILFETLILILLTAFCVYFFFLGYKFEAILTIVSFYLLSALRVGPPILHIYNSIITFNFAKKTIFQLGKEFSLKSNQQKIKSKKINFNNTLILKNINFKYENNRLRTLNKINLKINKNEFIGIVGASGSGKTTLINIVIGLLKPDSGKILVDNLEINNQDKNWINKIGYVPQNTFLLDSSIKENIAFGKFINEIDKNKIYELLKKTQLSRFLNKLPKKLNTNVGERGSKISEGQKQRIGIARALYKNPDILVFDEITSSLDELTEDKIMSDINKLKGKKTIFFISHKKNILKNCNKIIEVKNGKIKIFKNV